MTVTIKLPSCNLDTVRDGRGGIFTWLPEEPIVEFNMLYFRPGKVRGYHFHPHFKEYILVAEGTGVLVTREDPNDKKTEKFINLSKGTCTKTDKNTYHTIYALTEMTVIALLTKKWDQSDPPIIKVDE